MSPTLAARRARLARIRRTVAAATVAVFIALFATIYIQMAAGKDPALGTTVTASQTTGSSSSESTSSADSSASDSSSEVMTTAQS
jgi:hypothetical protein